MSYLALLITFLAFIKSHSAPPNTPKPTSSPIPSPSDQSSTLTNPPISTNITPSTNTPITETPTSNSPNIDCRNHNCAGTIINATTHPTIRIQCGDDMCKESTVYCPLGPDSTCNIICSEDSACQNMIINANTTDILTVECTSSYSCESMKVWAQYAGTIAITAKYHNSFANGELWATNAGNIEITCASLADNYACERSKWNIPYEGANTGFSCYGLGCKNIGSIHAEWDNWKLTIDINGCDECNGKQACLGSWSITCPTSNSTDSAAFYGNSCGTEENQYGQRVALCGCDDIVQRVTWTDNSGNPNCLVMDDVDDETTSASSSAAGAVSSIMFCICCIVVIAVCVKYGSRRGYHGGRNYTSPARGAQPAQMQPATMQPATMQPVSTQPAVMQQVVMQQQPQIVMQPMPQQYVQPMQYVQPVQYAQPMPQQYVQPVPQQTGVYYPQGQQAVMQPLQPQYAPSVQSQVAPSAPGAPEAGEGNATNC